MRFLSVFKNSFCNLKVLPKFLKEQLRWVMPQRKRKYWGTCFLFFSIFPMNTFNSNIPFPFLTILTILLSQRRLFKTIQVSNPDPLWARSCKLYSRIFLIYIYDLVFSISNRNLELFQHNYLHQRQYFFALFSNSYGDKSQLHLPASLLNR